MACRRVPQVSRFSKPGIPLARHEFKAPTVREIVTVRVLGFNRIHRVSNTSTRPIPQQLLENSKILQSSIIPGIRRGRGSEIQILSPDQCFLSSSRLRHALAERWRPDRASAERLGRRRPRVERSCSRHSCSLHRGAVDQTDMGNNTKRPVREVFVPTPKLIGGLAQLFHPFPNVVAPPFAGFEGWAEYTLCGRASAGHHQAPLLVNQHRPALVISVVPETAPRPLFRLQHHRYQGKHV